VLLGVGAGAGAEGKLSGYTKMVYDKFLNKELYHSARDERSKQYMERLGLKALNTGCVTMWMLTPEHCAQIPTKKSESVVFTLTASNAKDVKDQQLINILLENYKEVYYWPQGHTDYDYLQLFDHIENIKILPATKEAYNSYLTDNETDYVGTRLHGGVYALRHKRRSIIIAIDERARAINSDTNLLCIEKNNLSHLSEMINSDLVTNIQMPFDAIRQWKHQFGL
jgi:polysaccharide pyruvyl transferase WcaK-like protein